MKGTNVEETKDKLLAYYGDESAQKRTRKRIAVSNAKVVLIMIPIVLLITALFSLLTGFDAFVFLLKIFSMLMLVPAIGTLIIEYIFIILEGYGFGLSLIGGVSFLIIDNFTNSYSLSALIAILLLFIICQWYSNDRFKTVVDKARIELLNNNIDVTIINNKIEFK